MRRPLRDLPTVVTAFALGEAYVDALEGMLESIREHHPDWRWVVGRGSLPADRGRALLEVDSPAAPRGCWSPPVSLELDAADAEMRNWRKITRLKGWWLAEVWSWCRRAGGGGPVRILWLDVDARLNRPLEIPLDPPVETVAAVWWDDPETITSGLLLLQGAPAGPLAGLLAAWAQQCLEEIAALPPRRWPWPDGDQEVLDRLLRNSRGIEQLRLPYAEYCAGRNDVPISPQSVVIHGCAR